VTDASPAKKGINDKNGKRVKHVKSSEPKPKKPVPVLNPAQDPFAFISIFE
jgi:hypothetical protein